MNIRLCISIGACVVLTTCMVVIVVCAARPASPPIKKSDVNDKTIDPTVDESADDGIKNFTNIVAKLPLENGSVSVIHEKDIGENVKKQNGDPVVYVENFGDNKINENVYLTFNGDNIKDKSVIYEEKTVSTAASGKLFADSTDPSINHPKMRRSIMINGKCPRGMIRLGKRCYRRCLALGKC